MKSNSSPPFAKFSQIRSLSCTFAAAFAHCQRHQATVPITSRFGGKVAKLHYAVGDMASVGTPLCDITVDEDAEGGMHPSLSLPIPPSLPTPILFLPTNSFSHSEEEAEPAAEKKVSPPSTPAPPVESAAATSEEISQTITTARGSRVLPPLLSSIFPSLSFASFYLLARSFCDSSVSLLISFFRKSLPLPRCELSQRKRTLISLSSKGQERMDE